MWLLEIELRTSGTAGIALNHWAISPARVFSFLRYCHTFPTSNRWELCSQHLMLSIVKGSVTWGVCCAPAWFIWSFPGGLVILSVSCMFCLYISLCEMSVHTLALFLVGSFADSCTQVLWVSVCVFCKNTLEPSNLFSFRVEKNQMLFPLAHLKRKNLKL